MNYVVVIAKDEKEAREKAWKKVEWDPCRIINCGSSLWICYEEAEID